MSTTNMTTLSIFFSPTPDANILSHTFSGGFPTDLLQVNEEGQKKQPILLSTEQGLVYDFNVRVSLGEKNLGSVRLGLSRKEIDRSDP